jgi:hypothetical protein
MRRRTKWIIAAIVVLCLGYAFWRWMFDFRFTESDVKHLIEASVPKGASREKVMSFLKARGWQPWDYIEPSAEERGDPNNVLYGAYSAIYTGTENNIGSSPLELGHISLVFTFDAQGRLIRYHTKQYFTAVP